MPKPADVPSLREGHSPDIGVIWPPQGNLVLVSVAFFATSRPARSCWVRSSGYPVCDVVRRCAPSARTLAWGVLGGGAEAVRRVVKHGLRGLDRWPSPKVCRR